MASIRYIDKETIEKIGAIIGRVIDAIKEICEKIKKIILHAFNDYKFLQTKLKEKSIMTRAPKRVNSNKTLAIGKRSRLFYCRNNC